MVPDIFLGIVSGMLQESADKDDSGVAVTTSVEGAPSSDCSTSFDSFGKRDKAPDRNHSIKL